MCWLCAGHVVYALVEIGYVLVWCLVYVRVVLSMCWLRGQVLVICGLCVGYCVRYVLVSCVLGVGYVLVVKLLSVGYVWVMWWLCNGCVLVGCWVVVMCMVMCWL